MSTIYVTNVTHDFYSSVQIIIFVLIAVDPHDGGQSLVVVPKAAAPRSGDHPGSAASDAVCLGCLASCQHHSQVYFKVLIGLCCTRQTLMVASNDLQSLRLRPYPVRGIGPCVISHRYLCMHHLLAHHDTCKRPSMHTQTAFDSKSGHVLHSPGFL